MDNTLPKHECTTFARKIVGLSETYWECSICERRLKPKTGSQKSVTGGSLTFEEILIAARNFGINLECGGCATVFYTGNTDISHDDNCRLLKNDDDTLKEYSRWVKTQLLDWIDKHKVNEGFGSYEFVNKVKLIKAIDDILGNTVTNEPDAI